jgi:streptogramin lyase
MRRRLAAARAGVLALLAVAVLVPPAQAALGRKLVEGDIIVLDILDDAVYHVDPSSGTVTTIVSGSQIPSPRGVAISREGLLYVADTGLDWLLRIDPETGDTVPFFGFSSPTIPEPGAALMADNGDILVVEATNRRILRVDPATGRSSVEFQLTGTWFPTGLASAPDGTLIVVDRLSNPGAGTLAGIWRVDVTAGTQDNVLTSTTFKSLRTVAVQSDGDILVADRGVSGQGAAVYCLPTSNLPATNCAPCVPPDCPPPDPATFDDSFVGPNGVAVDPADDSVLVIDYLTGDLVRLDSDGGNPDLLSSSFGGPYVVAVVPELSDRRDHDEFLISDESIDGAGPDGEVYRADAAAGDRTSILAPGDPIAEPRAMAFAHPSGTPQDGTIFVIDGPDTILRVDFADGDQTGEQAVVGSDAYLSDLSDIAVDFYGDIIVTDRDGEVIRVDPATGNNTQEVIASALLGEPTSLVVDGNGSIIVTDRDPVADDTPEDDSGLFRVNPLMIDSAQQLSVLDLASSGNFIKFIEPKALARDFNGDLLLIAGDDDLVPSQIYRVFGADDPGSFALGVAFSTDLDGSLADAVAMVVREDRDLIVAFDVAEPRRVDPLTGASTLLSVGGDFADATDLVYQGMPEPGEPKDGDADQFPDGIDNCPDVSNSDQSDANTDGTGDVCQLLDFDLDGIPDFQDNCPVFPNPPVPTCSEGRVGESCTTNSDCDDAAIEGVCSSAQEDEDDDGVGDRCDNCRKDSNFTQIDTDGDGIGDACDHSDDDGLPDGSDNCPNDDNPGQTKAT